MRKKMRMRTAEELELGVLFQIGRQLVAKVDFFLDQRFVVEPVATEQVRIGEDRLVRAAASVLPSVAAFDVRRGKHREPGLAHAECECERAERRRLGRLALFVLSPPAHPSETNES